MTFWTRSPESALRGEPTPLLRHLASEHAPRVAGLWPAPHSAFINAGADRRHLICLALSRPGETLDQPSADSVLESAVRRSVRNVAPDAPAGLARALAHLGEVAWAASDYRRLEDALRVDALAARLRHARLITADQLRVLENLPAALRDCGVGSFVLNGQQAEILAETFEALARRDGEQAALTQARGWASGSSVRDVLTRAKASLDREPATPPFPGSASLTALTTKAAILETAGRYRNCLAGYLDSAADGSSAFYEWTGTPSAVVQISLDPVYGWRLCQARIANNAGVPDEAKTEITAELRSWGVHVGRSVWDLQHALDEIHAPEFELETVEACVKQVYGG